MADLRDVYYAPGLHARLVSLGKIEGQGWDDRLCDGGMELRNRDGDLFANVAKVNNVYPVGLNVIPLRTALAACMTDGDDAEPTHDELVDKVAMVATAREPTAYGIRATLLTWDRSSVFQDCGCVSRERRERYGDYGPTGVECVRCMCRSERGTLPA